MVPQYVFTYRQNKRENFKGDIGIFIWIICIGLYRVFYFFNWIYRVSHTDQEVQWASWLGKRCLALLYFELQALDSDSLA